MTNANLKVAASTKIRIDRGLPLPSARAVASKYPLRAMEVGDSFAVPADTPFGRIATAAFYFGKRNNRKYAVRTQPDGSLRCWRIA